MSEHLSICHGLTQAFCYVLLAVSLPPALCHVPPFTTHKSFELTKTGVLHVVTKLHTRRHKTVFLFPEIAIFVEVGDYCVAVAHPNAIPAGSLVAINYAP